MRTFVAIEIPQHVRKYVWSTFEGERQKDTSIKWVKGENMHITLKFLGEIDDTQQADISAVIRKIASQHEGFAVNLKGVGCFPNPKYPRVLWVGVEKGDEQLCTLAREIDEQHVGLGFKQEKRFHPHITVARMRKPCVIDTILAKSIKTGTFRAEAIVLFKSTLTPQGAIYEALERFPLMKAQWGQISTFNISFF